MGWDGMQGCGVECNGDVEGVSGKRVEGRDMQMVREGWKVGLGAGIGVVWDMGLGVEQEVGLG